MWKKTAQADFKKHMNRRKQPDNESKIQKREKAQQMLVVRQRHTHTLGWIWSIETLSMSGMYTMLPLTQVLREKERERERKEGERKGRRETGTVVYVSGKTGAGDTGEDVWGGVLLKFSVQWLFKLEGRKGWICFWQISLLVPILASLSSINLVI